MKNPKRRQSSVASAKQATVALLRQAIKQTLERKEKAQ